MASELDMGFDQRDMIQTLNQDTGDSFLYNIVAKQLGQLPPPPPPPPARPSNSSKTLKWRNETYNY